MKIVYICGDKFLEEGLKALEEFNAEIIPLQIDKDLTFQANLELVCKDPDLIIVELFGNQFIPTDIADCSTPTLAYGIDSTINTYLYKHLFKLFDYVFIDQKNACQILQKANIDAKFLPLCISSKHFREQNIAPDCPISFIGRMSRSRKKRSHLIAYIEQNHPISLFSKVTIDEMQNIIANSRITLNENLFNGLNFRVLQSLAAGSLLFNEENMLGVEDFFKANEHYIPYNPDNLIALIKEVENNPVFYQNIALKGQELCKEFHTSSYRVKEMFALVYNCELYDIDKVLQANFSSKRGLEKISPFTALEIAYHKVMYTYNFTQVFGGNLGEVVVSLGEIAKSNKQIGLKASSILLRLFACLEKKDKFNALYPSLLSLISSISEIEYKDNDIIDEHSRLYSIIDIYCIIASNFLLEKKYSDASQILTKAEVLLSNAGFVAQKLIHANNLAPINSEIEIEVELLYIIAQIYSYMNNIFELGFEKINNDPIPDTALKAAWFAWLKSYNSDILDFILEKANEYEIAGGLLDTFISATKKNLVNDKHKNAIQNIAKSYYLDVK